MIIYLAGRITGKDKAEYIIDFMKARNWVEDRGHTALCPLSLPFGMPGEKYMPICLSMIDQADAILLVGDDWGNSKGVAIERAYADYQGKAIYYSTDDVPRNDFGM